MTVLSGTAEVSRPAPPPSAPIRTVEVRGTATAAPTTLCQAAPLGAGGVGKDPAPLALDPEATRATNDGTSAKNPLVIRAPPSMPPPRPATPRRVPLVDTRQSLDAREPIANATGLYSAKSGERAVYAQFFLYGQAVTFLIDTGSECTILDADVYDKVVGNRCTVFDVNEKVVGVGSAKIDVVGAACVALQTPTRTLRHNVWIIKNLGVEGIIGMDMWKLPGETGLTCAQGYWQFRLGGEIIPALVSRQTTKVTGVRAIPRCASVHIVVQGLSNGAGELQSFECPPYCEIHVPCVVDPRDRWSPAAGDEYAVFEPDLHLPVERHLMALGAAYGLALVEGVIPVRITNGTDHPVRLAPGERMGTMEGAAGPVRTLPIAPTPDGRPGLRAIPHDQQFVAGQRADDALELPWTGKRHRTARRSPLADDRGVRNIRVEERNHECNGCRIMKEIIADRVPAPIGCKFPRTNEETLRMAAKVQIRKAGLVSVRTATVAADPATLRHAPPEPANLPPIDVSDMPEHVRDLTLRSTKYVPTVVQQQLVKDLIMRHLDRFSKGSQDLGRITVTEHTIRLTNGTPFKQRPRRLGAKADEAARAAVEAMIRDDIIEPCQSPWASPVVLAPKKDGKLRFCVDYRELNDRTIKDSWPLPHIADTLDRMAGHEWYSSLDMASGYWQVALRESDKPLTAFVTPHGQYQFKVLPFGLCNAPATFSRLVSRVMHGVPIDIASAYMDDVLDVANDVVTMIEHLDGLLKRFGDVGLKFGPEKCHFFQKQVKFLGHILSKNGISTDPAKMSAIQDWPRPTSVVQVQQFHGAAQYHRRFIKGFADMARDMMATIHKEHETFEWTPEAEQSFVNLKAALKDTVTLAHPREDHPFVLDTDASNTGIGAVLSQIINGEERPIAFYSRSLTPAARNYCVTRRELLAVVWALEHFRPYLWGRRFQLRTDHASLLWLKSFREPPGQLARWIELLTQFDYTMEHRAGVKHVNADTMSRRPCAEKGEDEKWKPCQHCNQAEKLHERCDSCPVGDPPERDINAPNEHYAPWHAPPGAATAPPGAATAPPGSAAAPPGAATAPPAPATNPPPAAAAPPTLVARTRLATLSGTVTVDQWNEWQDADETIRELKNMKTLMTDAPPRESYSASPPELKSYMNDWNRITVDDRGLLCRAWTRLGLEGDSVHQQILVPAGQRKMIMEHYHNEPAAGHLGRQKTGDRIKQRFHWMGIDESIGNYIRNCDTCVARRRTPGTIAPMQKYITGFPFERISIDIMEGLPPTTGELQYRFILVAGCGFSKWHEAIPLTNIRAETVARALFDVVLSRYGCPFEIHSDRGSNFESDLMKELTKLLGIRKTRTAAYHPQSDGMIERANWTIQKMLAAYVEEKQQDWHLWLQVVMMAYRSSVNHATGYTPNFAIFGREVTLPMDIETGIAVRGNATSPHVYVEGIAENMLFAHEHIRKHLGGAFKTAAYRYDRKATEAVFKLGDAVWYLNPVTKPGRKKKLCPIWDGPYVVTEIVNRVSYRIQLGPRARPKIINTRRLKPYEGSNPPKWFKPAKAAEHQGRANVDAPRDASPERPPTAATAPDAAKPKPPVRTKRQAATETLQQPRMPIRTQSEADVDDAEAPPPLPLVPPPAPARPPPASATAPPAAPSGVMTRARKASLPPSADKADNKDLDMVNRQTTAKQSRRSIKTPVNVLAPQSTANATQPVVEGSKETRSSRHRKVRLLRMEHLESVDSDLSKMNRNSFRFGDAENRRRETPEDRKRRHEREEAELRRRKLPVHDDEWDKTDDDDTEWVRCSHSKCNAVEEVQLMPRSYWPGHWVRQHMARTYGCVECKAQMAYWELEPHFREQHSGILDPVARFVVPNPKRRKAEMDGESLPRINLALVRHTLRNDRRHFAKAVAENPRTAVEAPPGYKRPRQPQSPTRRRGCEVGQPRAPKTPTESRPETMAGLTQRSNRSPLPLTPDFHWPVTPVWPPPGQVDDDSSLNTPPCDLLPLEEQTPVQDERRFERRIERPLSAPRNLLPAAPPVLRLYSDPNELNVDLFEAGMSGHGRKRKDPPAPKPKDMDVATPPTKKPRKSRAKQPQSLETAGAAASETPRTAKPTRKVSSVVAAATVRDCEVSQSTAAASATPSAVITATPVPKTPAPRITPPSPIRMTSKGKARETSSVLLAKRDHRKLKAPETPAEAAKIKVLRDLEALQRSREAVANLRAEALAKGEFETVQMFDRLIEEASPAPLMAPLPLPSVKAADVFVDPLVREHLSALLHLPGSTPGAAILALGKGLWAQSTPPPPTPKSRDNKAKTARTAPAPKEVPQPLPPSPATLPPSPATQPPSSATTRPVPPKGATARGLQRHLITTAAQPIVITEEVVHDVSVLPRTPQLPPPTIAPVSAAVVVIARFGNVDILTRCAETEPPEVIDIPDEDDQQSATSATELTVDEDTYEGDDAVERHDETEPVGRPLADPDVAEGEEPLGVPRSVAASSDDGDQGDAGENVSAEEGDDSDDEDLDGVNEPPVDDDTEAAPDKDAGDAVDEDSQQEDKESDEAAQNDEADEPDVMNVPDEPATPAPRLPPPMPRPDLSDERPMTRQRQAALNAALNTTAPAPAPPAPRALRDAVEPDRGTQPRDTPTLDLLARACATVRQLETPVSIFHAARRGHRGITLGVSELHDLPDDAKVTVTHEEIRVAQFIVREVRESSGCGWLRADTREKLPIAHRLFQVDETTAGPDYHLEISGVPLDTAAIYFRICTSQRDVWLSDDSILLALSGWIPEGPEMLRIVLQLRKLLKKGTLLQKLLRDHLDERAETIDALQLRGYPPPAWNPMLRELLLRMQYDKDLRGPRPVADNE